MRDGCSAGRRTLGLGRLAELQLRLEPSCTHGGTNARARTSERESASRTVDRWCIPPRLPCVCPRGAPHGTPTPPPHERQSHPRDPVRRHTRTRTQHTLRGGRRWHIGTGRRDTRDGGTRGTGGSRYRRTLRRVARRRRRSSSRGCRRQCRRIITLVRVIVPVLWVCALVVVVRARLLVTAWHGARRLAPGGVAPHSTPGNHRCLAP